MKKLFAPLVTLFVLVGCGSNVCDRYADTWVEKGKSCPALDAHRNEAEIDQCEQDVKSCTGEDIAEINRALDCAQGIGQCIPDREFEFALSFAGCFANRNISEGCSF
jgi:hypothetical protein